jgi:release factor glutamine methyltransferase
MFALMQWNEYYRQYLQQLQTVYSAEEATAITLLVFENKAAVARMDIVKFPDKNLTAQQKEILDAALKELLLHKPVQHITGEAWFYNLKFKVNDHVLIPRPETEELVQWIIDEHSIQSSLSIIDIGSGSGCIPIALKKNLPNATITSIDISDDALTVAKENAAINNTVVDFLQLDFLNEKEQQHLPAFDVIVSNPPYIPLNEKEKLDRNVTAYEPHTALFVPDKNPLLFYKAIAAFAKTHLKPDGKIYVETHEDLAKETAAVFLPRFKTVEIRKDINGKERMVKAINFLTNESALITTAGLLSVSFILMCLFNSDSRESKTIFVCPTYNVLFLSILTTTLCFALPSLFAFGTLIFITFGLAKVEIIKKKNIKMNRISFNGPVSTSLCSSLNFLRKLISNDEL